MQHAPGTQLAQGGGYPPGGYGPPGGGGPGAPGGYGPPGGPGGYGSPPGGPGGYGPPPGPGGYGGPPNPYGPPAPPYGAPYPPVAGPPYGGPGGGNPELKKQAQTWLIVSAGSFVLCSSCFGVIGAVLCYMAMQAVDQGNIADAQVKLKWGKIITGAGIGIMVLVIIGGIAMGVLGGISSALAH